MHSFDVKIVAHHLKILPVAHVLFPEKPTAFHIDNLQVQTECALYYIYAAHQLP